jgi:PKD repeat protein
MNFWAYVDGTYGAGVQSWAWDFGDGGTHDSCCFNYQFTQDGDYTVRLDVTLTDGRSGFDEETIKVQTHNVQITRFSLPTNVRVGQSRPIYVSVANTRYPETVQVQLYKSMLGSWEWISTQELFVRVAPLNQPTRFTFSTTFTPQDAAAGSVNFRAVATIIGARDVNPTNNEAISLPVKVKK